MTGDRDLDSALLVSSKAVIVAARRQMLDSGMGAAEVEAFLAWLATAAKDEIAKFDEDLREELRSRGLR